MDRRSVVMKINKSLVGKIKETTRRTAAVPFSIDGEEYIVNVSTFPSVEIKEKLIQEMVAITEEVVEKYGEETVGLFVFAKIMTDIEWTEDFNENMELFLSLTEIGVVNKIFDAIPETTMQDLASFASQIAETQEQLLEVQKSSK